MKARVCFLILVSLVALYMIAVNIFTKDKEHNMGTVVSDGIKEAAGGTVCPGLGCSVTPDAAHNRSDPPGQNHGLSRPKDAKKKEVSRCPIRIEMENQLEESIRNGSSLIMANEVFKERRDLYKKSCNRSCPNSRHVDMFIMPSKALSVCHTPKVGCTFWKKIFRFLWGDVEKGTTSPYQVSRYFVHSAPFKKKWVGKLNEKEVRSNMRESIRAVFVREPYARLWSAYVDKFILADFFSQFGRDIVRQQRRNASTTERDSEGQPCGSDVTFPEFLAWSLNSSDPHWHPITQLCPPCLLQPHVIGRMETFAADTALLLKASGLQRFAEEGLSRKDYVKNEMWSLTEYQFRANLPKTSLCLDAEKLAARLWQAFQVNGYLPAEQEFPAAEVRHLLSVHSNSTANSTSTSNSNSTANSTSTSTSKSTSNSSSSSSPTSKATSNSTSKSTSNSTSSSTSKANPTSTSTDKSTSMERLLFEFYYRLHQAAGKTSSQWKQQKRAAMLRGYRLVPLQTLLAVRDKFQEDFQAFGYDPMPPDIFENRV